MTFEPSLPFEAAEETTPPADSPPADAAARHHAVDPAQNVVLEASAGTGKTRVLVERYVNLLRAGVDPDHILAMTFTRKAAAEMRERILEQLRDGTPAAVRAEIQVATIDAFCFGLLREFPLEAGVDPGFEIAMSPRRPFRSRHRARSAWERRLASRRRSTIRSRISAAALRVNVIARM